MIGWLFCLCFFPFSTTVYMFPPSGTLLGGSFKLRGGDLALACFSGINFRSNKWAVFHLSDPTISFTTEAQFVRPVGVEDPLLEEELWRQQQQQQQQPRGEGEGMRSEPGFTPTGGPSFTGAR